MYLHWESCVDTRDQDRSILRSANRAVLTYRKGCVSCSDVCKGSSRASSTGTLSEWRSVWPSSISSQGGDVAMVWQLFAFLFFRFVAIENWSRVVLDAWAMCPFLLESAGSRVKLALGMFTSCYASHVCTCDLWTGYITTKCHLRTRLANDVSRHMQTESLDSK